MFPKREIRYAVGKTKGIKSTISTRTKGIKQLNVSKTQDMIIDFRSEHPLLHRSLSFGSRQCKWLNHKTDWCKEKKKASYASSAFVRTTMTMFQKSDIETVLTFLVISFGELSKTVKVKGEIVDAQYHRHVLQKIRIHPVSHFSSPSLSASVYCLLAPNSDLT